VIGNRYSVLTETIVPQAETVLKTSSDICINAPEGVNTFEGGHQYDQIQGNP
jgi:hypothetical protein